MTCPACHRETSPVQIGSGQYCAKCGQRFEARTGNLPVARPRGMDISVARHPQTKPAEHTARPRPAHAGAHALDLRAIKPKAVESAHPVIAPKPQRVEPKTVSKQLDAERLVQAKQVQRSEAISRFGHHNASAVPPSVSPVPVTPMTIVKPIIEPEVSLELPTATVTHHEALVRLMETTKSETKPTRSQASRRGRVAATAAAIVIMGGYIWLQNYPKMAVQSASNRSGISASLPGYLPSSYSLAGTEVQSGLVTLSFKSPSQSEPLTIKQNRTAWDSASLLDNYVATSANEYSSIQQQGLTVYLMNNNVATWVNHGIWYTISGTGRLSRDQILKIAYSL